MKCKNKLKDTNQCSKNAQKYRIATVNISYTYLYPMSCIYICIDVVCISMPKKTVLN